MIALWHPDTYVALAEYVEQNNNGHGHQGNDYVQTQRVHIRQTGIAEHLLEDMDHWYGGQSE